MIDYTHGVATLNGAGNYYPAKHTEITMAESLTHGDQMVGCLWRLPDQH